MPTIRTVTVKGGGAGDYSSQSAAEAGEQGDLVSLDRQLNIECYASAAPDSTAVEYDGWTLDATRYVDVYAPTGERHAGLWNTGKYYMQLATGIVGGVITNREAFARFRFLQVRNTAASPAQFQEGIYSDAPCTIDSCIVRDGWAGIDFAGTTSSGSLCRNSIAYGASQAAGRSTNGAGGANTWQNCTLIGGTYGLDVNASGVYAVCDNVYAHGGTQGFTAGGSAGGVVTKTNCASSDTTASNNTSGGGATNCLDNVAHSTANFTNVTAGSEDYHIPTGSALKDAGVNRSGTFTLDIDGDTRGATWDIGADEFVAAAAAGQPYSARVRGVPGMNYGGKIFTGSW